MVKDQNAGIKVKPMVRAHPDVPVLKGCDVMVAWYSKNIILTRMVAATNSFLLIKDLSWFESTHPNQF